MTKRAKEIVQVEGLSKPTGVWSVVTAATPGRMIFVSGLLAKNAAGDCPRRIGTSLGHDAPRCATRIVV
jgi:hypothetical protein